MALYTKEDTLPLELRFLPYDINSVMHFGNREYSKNGHRTIIFKDHNAQQNRVGLSDVDLKKIEIVYGPECRIRDRQEKIQLCQSYPGVARRKREADTNDLGDKDQSTTEPPIVRKKRDLDLEVLATKSLRVNPDITPPPENKTEEDLEKVFKDLGILSEVEGLVNHINNVSSLILSKSKGKYCNNNTNSENGTGDPNADRNNTRVQSVIEKVSFFTRHLIEHSLCEDEKNNVIYQRNGCSWNSRDPRCRNTYRSTKSGAVQYSTQHRPIILQHTMHRGAEHKGQYGRSGSDAADLEVPTTQSVRRKREIESTTEKPVETKDGTNKPEVSEKSETVANTKKEESQTNTEVPDKIEKETGLVMKAREDKEKGKQEADDIKAKGEEKKAVVVETDKKEETETKADSDIIKIDVDKKTAVTEQKRDAEDKKEVNSQNNVDAKGDNILRAGTMIPSLLKSRNGRRNNHRAKHGKENYEDQGSDTDSNRPKIKKRHRGDFKLREKHFHGVYGEENQQKIPHRIRIQKHMNIVQHVEIPAVNISLEVKDPYYEEYKPKPKKKIKTQYHGNQDIVKEEKAEEERMPKQKLRKEKRERRLPRTVPLTKKNEEFYGERRWTDGEVVYVLKEDTTYDLSDLRNRLAEVNAILKKKTCVWLKEIPRAEAKDYEDYIIIDNDAPDYITGRVGGKQKFGSLELYRGGQHRQHAAMMVMAMLGFYFEVSRHDRDKYIRVHMRHVRPDKLHHFEMIRSDATLALPYDYASATHPAWQFWRQIGRTGISTVATFKETDPDGSIMKSLGQNEKLLSDIDIVKINSVYGVACFQRQRANTDTREKARNETTKSLRKIKH